MVMAAFEVFLAVKIAGRMFLLIYVSFRRYCNGKRLPMTRVSDFDHLLGML